MGVQMEAQNSGAQTVERWVKAEQYIGQRYVIEELVAKHAPAVSPRNIGITRYANRFGSIGTISLINRG
jgi:uncharacterized protein YdhG (YjbR/CyaY superfamily)